MSPNLPRPRAILWDWDNTLVDNWDTIGDALNATLTAFGHAPWTMDEVRGRVRASMRDSFPKLFGDRWEEAGALFYRTFAERHLETLKPLPGADDALLAASRAGVYQAVVSNKTGRFLRAEAEVLGWSARFGALVGAGDAACDKPAVEPVSLALEPGGIEPGPQIWFVGDNEIDVACARNAGCTAVLVGDCEIAGPEREDARFSAASALSKWLLEL
ncbi:MAG: HAD family hydrolase [Alphaproteobacteria bacterium]|nr:HAD family hydrolase [Alphaproteobacteria bacterium]